MNRFDCIVNRCDRKRSWNSKRDGKKKEVRGQGKREERKKEKREKRKEGWKKEIEKEKITMVADGRANCCQW